MSVLVDNEHFHIERDVVHHLIRIRRTDSKFALADVASVFAPVEAALVDIDERWSLLVDMRRAPPRPEDGFEAAINQHMSPLMKRFRRRAILVRSAVGVLQINRVAKMNGGQPEDTAIFRDDEAGAEAWLAAQEMQK